MTRPHDAVILGAGPSGTMAARVLARAGLDVVVLDKARFPRPKVCGDCLHPRTWDLWERNGLAEGFDRLEHHPIRQLQLSADFRDPLTLDLPTEGRGERAVSRERLDHWLLDEAVAAGARFIPDCVPHQLLPGPVLTTSQGRFPARVLIAADGRNSWLAKTAGLSTPRRRCPRIAWQATLPARFASDAVRMTFFPEGYFGLAKFNSREANLCMVLKSGTGATPDAIAARFFPGCGPLEWRSSSPITRDPYTPARNTLLLAGDAARVVEPFTGEGIALALASGELAGRLAAQALRDGNLENLAGTYTREHRRLYRSLSWQNRLTRWLGEHPASGRWACRALPRPVVGAVARGVF